MTPYKIATNYLPEIFSAATGTTVAVYAQVFDPSSGVPTTIGIGTVCGILLWAFIKRTDTDQKTITTLIGEKKEMFATAIEAQKQYTTTMVDSQKQHTAAMVALTERIIASEDASTKCNEGILDSQREMLAVLQEILKRPCQLSASVRQPHREEAEQ